MVNQRERPVSPSVTGNTSYMPTVTLVGYLPSPSSPSGRTDVWYQPDTGERWWHQHEIARLQAMILAAGGELAAPNGGAR